MAEQQVATTIIKRTAEQLGNMLPDGPDGSLYPMLEYVPAQMLFYMYTDMLTPLGATTLIIDGVAFVALPLPCETDSNIALYVPSLSVAFVSSIYYRQQPFIGAVRGGTPRPIKKWIEQITAIKSMYPVAIGVSHSFPMIGMQKIQYELQWTINRMTYMMNYVISRLNNGMHPRDIAWNLENENAFLHGASGVSPQELYGYPYAAAMGTFANTLGWYTGSVEELEMVNKTTEAVRIVELMGGVQSVVSKIKNVLKNAKKIDDLRFALQLSAYALRACPTGDSVNRDAIKLYYAEACTRLGHLQINIPKRNTYLSAAVEVAAM